MDETDAGRETVGRSFAAFFPATGCIENDWAVFVCMCFFVHYVSIYFVYGSSTICPVSLVTRK